MGFYLLFQLLLTVILASSFRVEAIAPENYLTPVYLLLVTLMLAYRPYGSWVHNLGATLGMITTFSFLLWCLIRGLYPSALIEEEEIFAIFLILLLISLSFAVTLWRVAFELKATIAKKCYKEMLQTNVVK